MSSINSVSLIGRLTQDPAVTPSTETTRCKMRIAVQRGRGKEGRRG
jgi:single-stranded DNA-binding protein